MKNKDILINYMINKKETFPDKINMELLINCIYVYIQNKPVYFKYEPTFCYSILIFGIIGVKKEHIKLQKVLGSDIDKLGGKLSVFLEKES